MTFEEFFLQTKAGDPDLFQDLDYGTCKIFWEAAKPMWIPVTERMPDKKVTITAVKVEGMELPLIRIFTGASWLSIDPIRVTHWMVLPE